MEKHNDTKIHTASNNDSVNAGQESFEWISVKTLLPEKYEKVIITDGEKVCLHYKQSGWNYEGYEGDDLYALDCELCDMKHYREIDTDHITYWMRFPKPPIRLTQDKKVQ